MKQAGFAYLMLLALVAIVAMAGATAVRQGEAISRRERETELLYAGEQIRRALQSFESNTPSGAPRWPRTLEELVDDPRREGERRRHLRRVFLDPVTGSRQWGLLRSPDGLIVGVFSRSTREPLRKQGFIDQQRGFEKAATYQDWRFAIAAGTP